MTGPFVAGQAAAADCGLRCRSGRDRAAGAAQLVRAALDRVSPLAVPLMIGRESLPSGAADDELLREAESLGAAAMWPER